MKSLLKTVTEIAGAENIRITRRGHIAVKRADGLDISFNTDTGNIRLNSYFGQTQNPRYKVIENGRVRNMVRKLTEEEMVTWCEKYLARKLKARYHEVSVYGYPAVVTGMMYMTDYKYYKV